MSPRHFKCPAAKDILNSLLAIQEESPVEIATHTILSPVPHQLPKTLFRNQTRIQWKLGLHKSRTMMIFSSKSIVMEWEVLCFKNIFPFSSNVENLSDSYIKGNRGLIITAWPHVLESPMTNTTL